MCDAFETTDRAAKLLALMADPPSLRAALMTVAATMRYVQQNELRSEDALKKLLELEDTVTAALLNEVG